MATTENKASADDNGVYEINLEKVPFVHRHNVELLYEMGPGYTEMQYIMIIVTILKKINEYKLNHGMSIIYSDMDDNSMSLIIADYFSEYDMRASANESEIKSTKFAYLMDCINKDYHNLFDDIAGRYFTVRK